MEGIVEDSYRQFGPCLVLKGVFSDDLGHVYRAGFIEGKVIDRMVWLRVFDAPDLPVAALSGALGPAREINEHLTGSQLPAHSFFVEVEGAPAQGGDYTAGQPLNKVLTWARDEAFPLQPDNCLLIVEKIALGLVSAGAVMVAGEPLAHGFLHPGLLHLSNDGEVTVMGFGLGGALVSGLKNSEATPGARAYFAPEVLSEGEISARGDVYSLGAILFHLLTGTALPAAPADREAALGAAHLSWDGEPLPADIEPLLRRSLATSPAARFPSAAEFRTELDGLLYGGAYSPTTFNLALFMDRLFRAEIEADEAAIQSEEGLDPTPFIVVEPPPADPEEVLAADAAETARPEAVPPAEEGGSKKMLWVGAAGVAIVAAIAAVLWFTVGRGPQAPPPAPTPSAAEIAVERQAQDDRLRSLTQEMVQQMMADREEEIRQELIARQSRIEELQVRLQQSERRAATGSTAAADESATQKALMEEIKKQEEAQRAQEDALETERQQALEEADAQGALAELAVAGAAVATGDPGTAETSPAVQQAQAPPPTAVPSPVPIPTKPAVEKAAPAVSYGDYVSPEQVDSRPVVIKSQPLEWPRNAARSKRKGLVIVELTVNAGGGVEDVAILRADHTGWGIPEAAMEAATGYRFKPGTKDGVAVTTKAFVTWRYDFSAD